MMWSVLCGLASTVFAAQDGEVELRIVHTNDTHSCVMPVNPNSSDTALADKGGFVRRAALVRDLRAEDPDLLLFDSGDFSQGSAYYNLYKGDVEVKLILDWTTWRAYSARRLFPSFVRIIISKVRCWKDWYARMSYWNVRA